MGASLLDEVMPLYDVNEVHQTWVPASSGDAFAAIQAVTPQEIPVFRALMTLRVLPTRLTREPIEVSPSVPVLEQVLDAGFVPLGDRHPREVVVGAVGRFWRLAGNHPLREIRTREDFVRFETPGFAKVALNFTVSTEGSGSRIATETRIIGVDDAARRRFRVYWLVISPLSGLIRRAWLRAIRRRATRES